MREAQFRLATLRQQHQPDVDEFVFYRIGHIAQNKKVAPLFRNHHCTAIFFSASVQAGNGCREELRKAVIKSRTLPRRAMISSVNFSSACQSWPTHSGGMSPAISRTIFGSSFSIRESHGSNDSHPQTSLYTQFRA